MTDDPDTVARTLYGEARGEGNQGLQAVANVIANRAQVAAHFVDAHQKNHPLFGDGTLASACRVPWQFSCWNVADPNCWAIHDVDDSDPIFVMCLTIAQAAVDGQLPDLTSGALYYKVIGSYAKWAEGKTPCFTYGKHEFYNNIT